MIPEAEVGFASASAVYSHGNGFYPPNAAFLARCGKVG
jgi:hypothetical protein